MLMWTAYNAGRHKTLKCAKRVRLQTSFGRTELYISTFNSQRHKNTPLAITSSFFFIALGINGTAKVIRFDSQTGK
jgi:hypothetical protein